MLRILLAKDLRRMWRNPLPALINIALPLCITGLIALAFAGRSENELVRIKFAVVDEDQSFLSQMLRGSLNQKNGGERLEPVFIDRETALKQINENQIGGALIIPTNFTKDYFSGSETVKLELVKNPAQSIQPAALEELASTAVTILNALSRNFKAQFPDWKNAFDGELDHRRISTVIERVGDRVQTLKKYINPPLVTYAKEGEESEKNNSTKKTPAPHADEPKVKASSESPATNLAASNATKPKAPAKAVNNSPSNFSKIFGWVLPGISAMFLLFLANNAMSDLHREMRFRTFERYQTLRTSMTPFVVGKVLFSMVFLLICAVIMLGGGGLVFRVHWQQPLALTALVVGYAAFASGIMALFVALVPDERRANSLNSVISMLLGFAGGCMFPARSLPPFIRDHLTPYLPSNWFVEAAHRLQDGVLLGWKWVVLKLFIASIVLIGIAVAVFQNRIQRGLRA